MITGEDIVTVSELRKNTLAVFKKMNKSNKPLTIFSDSKPVGVIMSITMYTELQEETDSGFADEDYSSAWDFLINPPENIRIKKKGLSAVDIIRKDRD